MDKHLILKFQDFSSKLFLQSLDKQIDIPWLDKLPESLHQYVHLLREGQPESLSLPPKKLFYENNLIYARNATTNSELVFIIDIEAIYTIGDTSRSKYQGIKLLKWLRIKKIYNHCILTSFQPLNDVLSSSPFHGIITSKGTSFVQLPDNQIPNLGDIARDRLHAHENDLKQLLKMEVDFDKIRHEEANWWGLFSLYSFHSQLKNYTNEKIEKIGQIIESDLFYNIIRFSTDYKKINLDKQSKGSKATINTLKALHNLEFKPVVVFIDDHAEDGWADLLENIIFGQKSDNFIVINPKYTDSVENLYYQYKEKTLNKTVNLLISDLRFTESDDNETDYRKLKSYDLIKEIKILEEKNYNLKLMYLTAANNLAMYKNLLIENALRPNKLFIKEGCDMSYSHYQSFDNYRELINVYDLLKREDVAKTVLNVQTHDENEAIEIDKIMAGLVESMSDSTENRTIKNNFLYFSQIVVDTNVFITKQDCLSTCNVLKNVRNKLVVHIAVKKELESLRVRNEGLKTKMAEFYLNFIEKERIRLVGDVNIDNADINNLGKEFADDFLVSYAKESAMSGTQKILFVSDDRKKEPPGPYTQLRYPTTKNLIVHKIKEFVNQAENGRTTN